ncbi:MAG: hypothetical protein BroJett039_06790 [Chloroflexota bacterium]|nr:MAG: hypothetical protein BroJett039_06790 [Chloroflexota bacterium]
MVDGVQIGNLRSGQILSGRYVVHKVLGVGAMGAVYYALDIKLYMRVAIKEYLPARFTNPAEQTVAARMFEQEAQMLVRLGHHPNLPKISDYFREGMNQYMVMDFIDGITLEEYLQQYHRVPELQALEWGLQIASALDYLHSQNPPIIFRDMKPGNVMLDEQRRIKLIDFGIARKFKPGKAQDTPKFGTPGYAPPEQYEGRVDVRSDIYSLSATLYVLLTNYDIAQSPFRFPPIQNLAPALGPRIATAIMRGLEPDPSHRWQSIHQFQNALYPYPPVAAMTRSLVPEPMAPTDSFRGIYLVISRGLVFVLIVGVILLIGWGISTLFTLLAIQLWMIVVPLALVFVIFVLLFIVRRQKVNKSPKQPAPMAASRNFQTTEPSENDPWRPMPAMSMPMPAMSMPMPAMQTPKTTQTTDHQRKLTVQAVARIDLERNERAIQGRDYTIQAGISSKALQGFAIAAMQVSTPDPTKPLHFDIVIHADSGLDLLGEWFQSLTYSLVAEEPQLVEFRVRVVRAGHHSVAVDFYQERRWLKTIRLEFDSIVQDEAAAIAN